MEMLGKITHPEIRWRNALTFPLCLFESPYGAVMSVVPGSYVPGIPEKRPEVKCVSLAEFLSQLSQILMEFVGSVPQQCKKSNIWCLLLPSNRNHRKGLHIFICSSLSSWQYLSWRRILIVFPTGPSCTCPMHVSIRDFLVFSLPSR